MLYKFVTESWTSSDALDSQLCMTGYELYRFDRTIIICRNNLNNSVKNTFSTYTNVIICGDFNYPCINWNLLHASVRHLVKCF